MDVKVLTNGKSLLAGLRELAAWASEIRLLHAWAHSARGTAEHWLAIPPEKLTSAVIGVHFAQTEPYVLRVLHEAGKLFLIKDTAGVFHPKMVLGRRGEDVRAIIGSSNFTGGGYGANTELNLMLVGVRSEPAIAALLQFEDEIRKGPRVSELDKDWLSRYEAAHERRPHPPLIPSSHRQKRTPVNRLADLQVHWSAYYELIAEQERRMLSNGFTLHVFDHPDGSYLQEVGACQEAFARAPSFARMPLRDRRLVAGLPPDSLGFFGRMKGAGYFKNLVGTQPAALGAFLDQIPLHAEPDAAQVYKLLSQMVSLRGVALATATRLLAMKRPDRFLAINNANEPRIREVFGFFPASVPKYARMLEHIWSFPWANAAKPSVRETQQVWSARVALLDAVLYDTLDGEDGPGRRE